MLPSDGVQQPPQKVERRLASGPTDLLEDEPPGAIVETDPAQDPLAASRPFARSDNRIALWQVGSTTALVAAVWTAGALGAPWQAWPLLGMAATGLFVRMFVLQHDCGHMSLFDQLALNEVAGRFLACVSGVAFHAWRSEHNWHHAHQGKLTHRGIDGMNSPMTVLEALADPAAARATARTITPLKVGVLVTISFLMLRKRRHEFFQFREAF